MKWSVIRPKVLEVVSDIVGIATYWRDKNRPFVTPDDEATCLLHVVASGNGPGFGDDFRRTYNAGTNKLDLTQSGIRLFTMSVLVESYNHADDKQALEYLEEVRDALNRPQILALLRAVNLAVRDVSTTKDLSSVEDNHVISSASVDVFFAYGNNVASDDGKAGLDPLDWIETVGGMGTTSEDVTPITAEVEP